MEEAQILREPAEDGRVANALRRRRVSSADMNLAHRKATELQVVVHLPSTYHTKSPGRHACA